MGVPHLRTKLPFSKNVINSPGGGFYNINRIESSGGGGGASNSLLFTPGGTSPYPYFVMDGSNFLPTTEATFSFWAKSPTNGWQGPTSFTTFINISEATGFNDVVLGCWLNAASSFTVGAGTGNKFSFIYSIPFDGGPFDLTGWNHIFGVYNGANASASRMRCWINNQEITLILNWGSSTSLPQDGQPLYIRSSENSGVPQIDTQDPGEPEWFIDEVALWDSDQSANVSDVWNGGTPGDLSTLSPNIWFTFDGVSDLSEIPNAGILNETGSIVNNVGRVSLSTDVP